VMKSALGVSWVSGLIPGFGCQRDERSRVGAEAKRSSRVEPVLRLSLVVTSGRTGFFLPDISEWKDTP